LRNPGWRDAFRRLFSERGDEAATGPQFDRQRIIPERRANAANSPISLLGSAMVSSLRFANFPSFFEIASQPQRGV